MMAGTRGSGNARAIPRPAPASPKPTSRTHARTYTRARTRTHTHTHAHTDTQTHTHTNTSAVLTFFPSATPRTLCLVRATPRPRPEAPYGRAPREAAAPAPRGASHLSAVRPPSCSRRHIRGSMGPMSMKCSRRCPTPPFVGSNGCGNSL